MNVNFKDLFGKLKCEQIQDFGKLWLSLLKAVDEVDLTASVHV